MGIYIFLKAFGNLKQPTRINGRERKPFKTANRKDEAVSYGVSKLETFFARNFLDKLNVDYIYEFKASDIGRFYDFAIIKVQPGSKILKEEKNGVEAMTQENNVYRVVLCVEIDGSFFHSDPRFYDRRKLTPMQRMNKIVDGIKDDWCKRHNIPLLRLWEYDIRNNPKEVMETVTNAIKAALEGRKVQTSKKKIGERSGKRLKKKKK